MREGLTTQMSILQRKRYEPGALVMVSIEQGKGQTNNPAVKFNGQEFRILYKHQPKPTVRPQFILDGCEGEDGKPYWFLEDELILI